MTNGGGDDALPLRLDGFRVLVVEDEFLVAEVVRCTLADLGCAVVGPIARLLTASKIAREEEVDGAVLDVNVNGEKIDPVARALRERGVPIILTTGYGEANIAPDLRTLPRLTKPCDAKRLEELAVKVFAGCPDK